MREPNRERINRAFEIYWNLGDNRTHQEVADRLKLSKRAIDKYAVKDNWTGRIIQRENFRTEESNRQALQQIRREESQKTIALHNQQIKFLKRDVPIQDYSEYDTVDKNISRKLGLPTDHIRQDQNITGEVVLSRKDSNDDLFVLAKQYAPQLEQELYDAFTRLLDVERQIREAKTVGQPQTSRLDPPARSD